MNILYENEESVYGKNIKLVCTRAAGYEAYRTNTNGSYSVNERTSSLL
ncbi:hypothetical protein [Clostridium sp.]|nr:hypothetical protein [uncultured Clostridium sp.]